MRFSKSVALAVALVALLGCRQSDAVKESNLYPEAQAEVIGNDGFVVATETFELAGDTVEVTLVGDASKDGDGHIVEYQWLSATSQMTDAGMALPGTRRIAEGAAVGWPADEPNPKVVLTEGVWKFSLWVTDDRGAVSQPDVVTVTVVPAAVPDAGM